MLFIGSVMTLMGTVLSQAMQRTAERDRAAIEIRRSEQIQAVGYALEVLDRLGAPISIGFRYVAMGNTGASDSSLQVIARQYAEAESEWLRHRNRSYLLTQVVFGDTGTASLRQLDTLVQQTSEVLERYAARRAEDLSIYPRGTAIRLRDNFRQMDSLSVLQLASIERAFRASSHHMATQIQMRQTGSFDPLASFMVTPWVEYRLSKERPPERRAGPE